MKVLVTGASGFIGRNVVAQLIRDGIEVVAASRHSPSKTTGASFEAVDLLEVGAPARLVAHVQPTHLIHLAWNATPGRFWTAPDNLDWSAASMALVRAFADAGGTRAVIAGSCAEYDWTGAGVLREDSPTAPATFYGKVKDATRRALCAYGDQTGLSLAWGRVFWLYGPEEAESRLVSDVASAFVKRRPVETTEGRQCRDFMHVEDVAGAFVTALTSHHCGPFNIGSGVPVAVRELIACLATELNGNDLVRFGSRPSPIGDPPLLAADTTILHQAIGFEPRYTLEAGLRSTARWWRDTLQA